MNFYKLSTSLFTHSFNGGYRWWDALPEALPCFPAKLAFCLHPWLKELGKETLENCWRPLVPHIIYVCNLETVRNLATTISVIASTKVTPQNWLDWNWWNLYCL